MFCRYCGKEIDDDQLFCPFCGEKVKKSKSAATAKTSAEKKPESKPSKEQTGDRRRFVNEQFEKDQKREKKPAETKKTIKGSTIAIIILSVLLAIGLGTGAYFMFGHSGDKTGDQTEDVMGEQAGEVTEEQMSVDLKSLMYGTGASGYSGYGELDEDLFIDEQKMDAYLGTIKDEVTRSAVKGVLLTVKYHPDRHEKLSNGDVVTITAEYDKAMAEDIKLQVQNESFEYMIDGLEEGEDIAYDPETCDQYADDFIFTGSDDRNLSEEDFEYTLGFDEDLIQRGINEIYARHGMIFEDSFYKKFYEKCSWYTPVYTQKEFKSAWLNKYENANLKALTEYRQQVKNMLEEDN